MGKRRGDKMRSGIRKGRLARDEGVGRKAWGEGRRREGRRKKSLVTLEEGKLEAEEKAGSRSSWRTRTR